MRKIPADRKYTASHLWFIPKGGDEGMVGLTDDMQMRLGDLIAVELPREDAVFSANDTLAYLEGILDSLELEAFSNLEIVEINPKIEIHPDIINRQPYGDGWIFKVKLRGVPRWMDAPGYAEFLEKGRLGEGA